MDNRDGSRRVATTRRSMLAMASGLAGLVTVKHWTTPVVQTVVLPAHAQTTDANPPQIFGLATTGAPLCTFGEPNSFAFFNIEYSFSSQAGIVSHVVTAACGDDALQLAGNNSAPGDNLLGSVSFALTGDEFSGSVVIDTNSIVGTVPLSCLITVTLTDANGDQSSATIELAPICVEP